MRIGDLVEIDKHWFRIVDIDSSGYVWGVNQYEWKPGLIILGTKDELKDKPLASCVCG